MNNLTAFHRALHAWYALHGRKDLPWRNTSDPYAIYISEIMLQQTQVETVRTRFYAPFLARFPTLKSLAEAEEQDVLKAWQGLGYYTRAQNLRRAAIASGGALPAAVESLLALPGIGRNTAHAVAAFAYRLPVPVMEANVKRVLHRIFALEQATDALLWEKAEALLDVENPYDYNQAMMDIGATICTPRAPKCLLCPASVICRGQAAPERYPAKKPKRIPPTRRRRIVIARDRDGRIHAAPRETRFLKGMYRFIETEADAAAFMLEEKPYPFEQAAHLGHIAQVYSHFTLEAEVYCFTLNEQRTGADWHAAETLASLPWSKAELKMLALLG